MTLLNPFGPFWRLIPLLCLLALPARAARAAPDDTDDHGAYLSITFGDGRIAGGNAGRYADGTGGAERSMRGRAFELRAGRQRDMAIDATRIDIVHYNEGHPENNHRDGFAVQWLGIHRFGPYLTGEAGLGPFLSMNTTIVDGRQLDDTRLGLLLSAALRLDLPWAWPGTHVRLAYDHVHMTSTHRSDALLIGIGRQFGAVTGQTESARGDAPADAPVWLSVSAGAAITNMRNSNGAPAARIEVQHSLPGTFARWSVSAGFVYEGDDDGVVDRRGLAAQLWYRQPVTPRFTIGIGLGPYAARNRYENDRLRGNLLIGLRTEWTLSRRYRVFAGFDRVKTFSETNDRDLYLIGLLRAF